MKKLLGVLFILCTISSFGQLTNNYAYSVTTGSFTPLSGATIAVLDVATQSQTQGDQGFTSDVPIGFNFNFNQNLYSTVSFNVNGLVYIGSSMFNAVQTNSFSGNTSGINMVAPFWDDLFVATTSSVSYKLSGTLPNRVFTIQWLNLSKTSAGTPTFSMQLNLYEATGVIESIYRKESGNESFTGTIGLSVSNSDYISLGPGDLGQFSGSPDFLSNPSNNQVVRFSPTYSLPVKLGSLNALLHDEQVKLNWQTLSEQNNKGFSVQRFTGNDWQNITFVNGYGNSSTPKNYSYTDIPKSSGTILYRLQQIDFDGKTSLSNVVKVDLGERKFILTNSPNPASTQTTIEYNLKHDARVLLQLFTASGIPVRTFVDAEQKAGSYQYNIDVSTLAKGIYYFTIRTGEIKQTKKLVIN